MNSTEATTITTQIPTEPAPAPTPTVPTPTVLRYHGNGVVADSGSSSSSGGSTSTRSVESGAGSSGKVTGTRCIKQQKLSPKVMEAKKSSEKKRKQRGQQQQQSHILYIQQQHLLSKVAEDKKLLWRSKQTHHDEKISRKRRVTTLYDRQISSEDETEVFSNVSNCSKRKDSAVSSSCKSKQPHRLKTIVVSPGTADKMCSSRLNSTSNCNQQVQNDLACRRHLQNEKKNVGEDEKAVAIECNRQRRNQRLNKHQTPNIQQQHQHPSSSSSFTKEFVNWEEGFMAMGKFVRQFGSHPDYWPANKMLALWLSTQYREELNDRQTYLLDALCIPWDVVSSRQLQRQHQQEHEEERVQHIHKKQVLQRLQHQQQILQKQQYCNTNKQQQQEEQNKWEQVKQLCLHRCSQQHKWSSSNCLINLNC